jgi:hypothetical protein
MKPTTVPIICGIALAAISSAGLSHWWSVRTMASAFQSGLAIPTESQPVRKAVAAPQPEPLLAARKQQPSPVASQPDSSQKKFFEALIQKMGAIENQNRDLVDQLAETNRDMMKLEFRVDTHSESFRPLPTSEEPSATTYDDGPGVLPPRAEPVSLPSGE